MANTYVDTKINGIDVCCDVHAESYIATDSWSPNEDGEIDLECVTVKREGQAFIDGKWIDAIVRIDLLPLLSDDAIDLLIEKCHDDLINDKG